MRFTPYGEPEAWSPFDVDRNGSITSDDSSLVTNSHAVIGTANYRSDLDVNRDGSVDDDDYTIVKYALGEPTPLPGELSVRQPVGNAAKLPLDNDLGFAGYVHLLGTGLYLSRYRVYDPRLGRWLPRDPIREARYPVC